MPIVRAGPGREHQAGQVALQADHGRTSVAQATLDRLATEGTLRLDTDDNGENVEVGGAELTVKLISPLRPADG